MTLIVCLQCRQDSVVCPGERGRFIFSAMCLYIPEDDKLLSFLRQEDNEALIL